MSSGYDQRNLIPVYRFLDNGGPNAGKPMSFSDLAQRNPQIKNAVTGNDKPSFIPWGTDRTQGGKFHGGVYHSKDNIISYH